jgi:transcription-repair coupling factor (superfamily II helicase)
MLKTFMNDLMFCVLPAAESGLTDVPNAIRFCIMFGLSDLHQMRGRVGRSNRRPYILSVRRIPCD